MSTFMALSLLLNFALWNLESQCSAHGQVPFRLTSASDTKSLALPNWIVHHAGPIAPFHQIGTYQSPPNGCKIVQVNHLQRHGSRYPTAQVHQTIHRALKKLKQSSHLDESLDFITDYQYHLGEDSLLPLGALESFEAGVQFASRYERLIDRENLPFIRASSSERVVDSAQNFTSGLASWLEININPIEPLVISEDPDLCIFESIADEKLSRLCGIFEHVDWPGYGYYYDLDKYYNHGLGNRLGQAEGISYVAELIARLTGDRKWVEQDESKVNQTLDQSWATFPLNQSSYVDFSHDNQMISILAALGIQPHEPLPATGPPPPHKVWDVSKWMPFSSRLTIEKMQCDHRVNELVRFVLNDMIIPIPSCNTSDQHPLLRGSPFICPLSQFIESRRSLLGNSENLHEQCSSTRRPLLYNLIGSKN
ncbi:hypothetical protein PGTUg99_021118 [Puccinia graminis f. sp. tritici]|uniref:Phytase A n=1 Tax=Puccinia graminis f. sp. tritici TaxID=56615 RepID=A0A5B0RQ63_PUCGR|nr:hypothetical protein PGTUg99_021118 [Puccinia graminis f. sp. tritici]